MHAPIRGFIVVLVLLGLAIAASPAPPSTAFSVPRATYTPAPPPTPTLTPNPIVPGVWEDINVGAYPAPGAPAAAAVDTSLRWTWTWSRGGIATWSGPGCLSHTRGYATFPIGCTYSDGGHIAYLPARGAHDGASEPEIGDRITLTRPGGGEEKIVVEGVIYAPIVGR